MKGESKKKNEVYSGQIVYRLWYIKLRKSNNFHFFRGRSEDLKECQIFETFIFMAGQPLFTS